jgi:hypothetical protein
MASMVRPAETLLGTPCLLSLVCSVVHVLAVPGNTRPYRGGQEPATVFPLPFLEDKHLTVSVFWSILPGLWGRGESNSNAATLISS